jgi:hypothetical protein
MKKERYPFQSVVDSQGGVHWVHITAAEEPTPPLPQINPERASEDLIPWLLFLCES